MTMFKLVVLPNGKAILTTEKVLSYAELEDVRGVFKAWQEADAGRPLMMASTEVVQVTEIELNLDQGNHYVFPDEPEGD